MDTPATAMTRNATEETARSLPTDVDESLLRGVTLSVALSGWCKHWAASAASTSMYDVTKTFDLSFQVSKYFGFLSHDWKTSRWSKLVTMLILFNLRAAAVGTVPFVVLYGHFGPWRMNVEVMQEETLPFMLLHATPYLVALFFLCMWQRIRSVTGRPLVVFLDKLCIQQHDSDLKAKGIRSLASFLDRSEQLFILWSPRYQPVQNSCGRMAEVLSKWRWRQVTATRFDTPHGQIDLASDGESAIIGAMKKAWEASIWRAEPRADHALVEGRALEYPVTKAHVQGIRGGLSTDQEAFLVATAAGKDSRKLAKQLKLDKIECLCGREWPSKTHVTWHCEQVHLQEVDRPQSRHEERLLLRTIQHPPPPPAHTGRLDQCNHALSQTFAQQEGVILAATDGSSKLAGPERRASWSVATSNGVHAFAREGHDQSIFTAEAWAVLQAFLAANHAAKPLRLICDNLSVVRQVQKIHAGG